MGNIFLKRQEIVGKNFISQDFLHGIALQSGKTYFHRSKFFQRILSEIGGDVNLATVSCAVRLRSSEERWAFGFCCRIEFQQFLRSQQVEYNLYIIRTTLPCCVYFRNFLEWKEGSARNVPVRSKTYCRKKILYEHHAWNCLTLLTIENILSMGDKAIFRDFIRVIVNPLVFFWIWYYFRIRPFLAPSFIKIGSVFGF
jgi:hypothetical protein